jgi:hypothetical protein
MADFGVWKEPETRELGPPLSVDAVPCPSNQTY